jgi:hypothetical protein
MLVIPLAEAQIILKTTLHTPHCYILRNPKLGNAHPHTIGKPLMQDPYGDTQSTILKPCLPTHSSAGKDDFLVLFHSNYHNYRTQYYPQIDNSIVQLDAAAVVPPSFFNL